MTIQDDRIEPSDYWLEREKEFIDIEDMNDKEIMAEIQRLLNGTKMRVATRIFSYYAKYAEDKGITKREAAQQIDRFDLEDFEDFAAKAVADKDFSAYANKLLKTYNVKMYITRERLILNQLHQILIHTTGTLEQMMFGYMDKAAMREIERQGGILAKKFTITKARIKAIINKPFQNVSWSKRLWRNMDKTRQKVESVVTDSLLTGKHPNSFIKEVRDELDASASDAQRLLITETARVQTEITKQTWTEAGFDVTDPELKYVYIAVIDGRTTKTCRTLHMQRLPVNELQVGHNAPPMHPRCRSRIELDLGDWRTEFMNKKKARYQL